MAEKELGEKLRYRRESLGHSQDYLGAKLGISQAAVSFIESGNVKITDEMMGKIKAIEGYEDFDKEVEVEKIAQPTGPQPIVVIWPFGKTSFYILIAGVALFLLGQAFTAAEEMAEGFGKGAGPDATVHVGLVVAFVSVFGFLIYWFFWKKKW